MTSTGDLRVSCRGQMSLPSLARHRGASMTAETWAISISMTPSSSSRAGRRLCVGTCSNRSRPRTGATRWRVSATMSWPASGNRPHRPSAPWKGLAGTKAEIAGGAEDCTMGYWYVRLCQAALGANERTGVLSRPFAELSLDLRDRALKEVLDLPENIGMASGNSAQRLPSSANTISSTSLGSKHSPLPHSSMPTCSSAPLLPCSNPR